MSTPNPDPDQAPGPSTTDQAPSSQPDGRSRLRAALLARPGRGAAIGALLLALLGFALVTQVRSVNTGGLEQLRTSDLVRILDDQNAQAAKLDAEERELTSQRDALVSGSATGAAAVAAARERLDTLSLLTGASRASGPGITLAITASTSQVDYPIWLDLVGELRDAGAEAIEINGVRVSTTTWFGVQGGGLVVDGTALHSPYTVTAIGDPATLSSAMKIPGGIVQLMTGQGAAVTVTESKTLTVGALHTFSAPRYAHPVPAASAAPAP